MLDQSLYNKNYLGRDGFYWWIGQIPDEKVWKDNISGFPAKENTESKGFGERYKVRIMGSHLDSWNSDASTEDPDIPDKDLPWAVVMYPVTAGGGPGGSSASANICQGTFVFGFYLDGEDGQQPVIMGCLGNNDFNQVSANSSPLVPTTGYTERFFPSNKIKAFPGGEFADYPDWPIDNQAKVVIESVTGNNALVELASVVSTEDGQKKAALPPSPDCKSPISAMQLQIKNVLQDVQEAKKAAYDYRLALSTDIAEKQEWIENKIIEGAKIIAGAVKWLFTEIEKYVIARLNSNAKKLYFLLMPNERPLLKEGMELSSNIIACVFKKIMGKLFDIVLGFLKGMIGKVINTAECLVNNFLGGLLGQLAGLIDGAIGQAFGAVQSIISSVGGVIDGVLDIAGGALQMILDVLSFLSCEEKPECSSVEEWSLWDGASPAGLGDIEGLLDNITSVAGSVSNAVDLDNFDFNLDFDGLFDPGSCDTSARTCGPPTLDIFGSGTGAAINLIVSGGGEVLGADVVSAGYGYVIGSTYTKVKDDCGIGQGGVVVPEFGEVTDPDGNPSTGITGIVVTDPGKDYLPSPNGSTGGDGRIWANPEDTNVTNDDGTIRVPIPPENNIEVGPGDTVTLPPGTETETSAGQVILGGIPTVIVKEGVLTTPPLTIVQPLPEYPTLEIGSYPVILYLCDVIIESPGINYTESDEVVIEPSMGATVEFKLGDFGKIVGVKVTNGGEGFTEMPKITVKSQSGFNSILIPKFCIDRIGENDLERDPRIDPDYQDKIISVIDCVGKF